VGTAVTGVGVVVGVPALAAIYSPALLTSHRWNVFKPENIGSSASQLSQISLDQKGWNWIQKQKMLKAGVFALLLDDLKNPTQWPQI